jgi:glycosyltransferase involved in cell wall biosynthesis
MAAVQNLILDHCSSDLQIQHIANHEEGSILHRVTIFFRAALQLFENLLCKRSNLCHFHFSQRGCAFRTAILSCLVLLFRKPVVLHAHGSEFRQFFASLPAWICRLLSWVFCQSSSFVVLSEGWKHYYVNSLGLKADRVVVLPNPTVLPPAVPVRPVSKEIIHLLFLGRVGQRKGTFDLIEAFAALPAEVRNRSRLTIGGDGEVEKAQNLVRSLGLIDSINLPGWIGSEQRDVLLAKADVFILPSYNEGLPLALLEAMGWGLPAITTPVGGIPELVTHSQDGLLVTPGNIGQLTEAMKSTIEDENLRRYLGQNARERVMPLGIESYCVSSRNLYRSLVKPN